MLSQTNPGAPLPARSAPGRHAIQRPRDHDSEHTGLLYHTRFTTCKWDWKNNIFFAHILGLHIFEGLSLKFQWFLLFKGEIGKLCLCRILHNQSPIPPSHTSSLLRLSRHREALRTGKVSVTCMGKIRPPRNRMKNQSRGKRSISL